MNQVSSLLFVKCSYPIPQNRVRSPKHHINKGDDKRHFEGAFKTLRCCGHQPQVPYLPNSSEKFKGRDEKHLKTLKDSENMLFINFIDSFPGCVPVKAWSASKGDTGFMKGPFGSRKAEKWLCKGNWYKLDVVVHAYNPSTGEAETRRLL